MPDSAEAKREILQKIRSANAKFPNMAQKPDGETSANPFNQGEGDLWEAFSRALEANNGFSKEVDNLDEAIQSILSIRDQYSGGKISCVESELRALLLGAGLDTSSEIEVPVVDGISITTCDGLGARTGTIIIDSGKEKGRVSSIYLPVHIVIAHKDQLREDLHSFLEDYAQSKGEDAPSMLSLISGPSRTADIEKTLVLGAHGPVALYVLCLPQKFL